MAVIDAYRRISERMELVSDANRIARIDLSLFAAMERGDIDDFAIYDEKKVVAVKVVSWGNWHTVSFSAAERFIESRTW